MAEEGRTHENKILERKFPANSSAMPCHACAALLALSALGAGLVLGGVVDQKQIPAAACCICFAAVFLGSFLAAKHTAGKRLPAALAVAGCCFAVCFLARLTAFGNTQAHMLTPAVCMLAAALLAGILGGTRKRALADAGDEGVPAYDKM